MSFFIKLLLKAGFTLGIMFLGYRFLLPNMGDIIPGMPGTTGGAAQGISELGNAVVEKDVTVYQWKDEHGVTHYGGTPPTGQGSYDKKEIRANTNVVQATKQTEEEDKPETQGSRIAKVGSIYSPEGVKNLMDDTKDLQKQMNDRTAEQDKLLDSLMKR